MKNVKVLYIYSILHIYDSRLIRNQPINKFNSIYHIYSNNNKKETHEVNIHGLHKLFNIADIFCFGTIYYRIFYIGNKVSCPPYK